MSELSPNDLVFRDNAIAVRESFAKMNHAFYWFNVTKKLFARIGVTLLHEDWDFSVTGRHVASFVDPITHIVYEVTIVARQK